MEPVELSGIESEEAGRMTQGNPQPGNHPTLLTYDGAALPTGHPDIGTNLSSLAVLYQNQGRYAAAEPIYKEAVAIMTDSLGADHSSTKIMMQN